MSKQDDRVDLLNMSMLNCMGLIHEYHVPDHVIRVSMPFPSVFNPSNQSVHETFLDLFHCDGTLVRRIPVVFAPDDWMCGNRVEVVQAVENLMRRGLVELTGKCVDSTLDGEK